MSLTSVAFILAFTSGMALALFRNPLYGLYSYVALFYLHPPSRWWGEMLPDLRWALLAAIITMFASFRLPADRTRAPWLSTTPARLLIAYTVWLGIQNGWAMDHEQHLEVTVLFAKYVLLFYLVYRLIDTEERIRDFLLVHILGCFYFGYLAFSMEVSGRLEGVGGPGIDEANALAMQMATGIAAAAMLFLGEQGWRRWLCFLALPFMLNTLVLSGSRGAFVGLLIAGLAMWRLRPEAYRRWFHVYAALGVVLFGILAHQAFWERISTIRSAVDAPEELDTSALSRLELVKAQWQMFREHPLGTGHRGTEVLSVLYLDEEFLSTNPDGTKGARSSHNTVMTALVEQGAPGAVIFAGFWIWAYRTCGRLKRTQEGKNTQAVNLVAAIGGALAAVLVSGMFVDYLKAEVQVWFFALLASLSAILASRISRPAATTGGAEVETRSGASLREATTGASPTTRQSSGYPAAASRSRKAGSGKP